MDKTQNRSKTAPKKRRISQGFFGALIFGVLTVVAIRLLVSLLLAFAISNSENPTSLVTLCSGVSTVLSLVFGGFVCAKVDKNEAFVLSLALGATVLALSCAFSLVYKINGGYDVLYKTVILAINFFCPMMGARLATGSGREKRGGRRRRM